MAKLTKMFLILIITVLWIPSVEGQVLPLMRETIERILKRGGGKIADETTGTIVTKTTTLLNKYGDETTNAILRYGDDGVEAVMLYGDDAITAIMQYGDDAVRAIKYHGNSAVVLTKQYGGIAARAMTQIEHRNGRRLIMMNDSGELAKIGGADKVFSVIEKYGNKAADFIWNNKGALAVATVAAAFYANPEPFINGTMKLPTAIGQNIMQPILDKMNGTVLTFLLVGIPVICVLLLFWRPVWRLLFQKKEKS